MARKKPNLSLRMLMLQAGFMLMILAILVRLSQLQILQHDFYAARVLARQHPKPLPPPPPRGTIYDSQGREMAVSVTVDSVYGVPNRLQQEEEIELRRISNILKLSERIIKTKLNSELNFVWLKRKISPDVTEELETLDVDGLGFRAEKKRYFPGLSLAAQVVGFAGIDHHGLEGAELFFDDLLQETDPKKLKASMLRIIDGVDKGNRIDVGSDPKITLPDLAGPCDLLLTIDQVIQYQTEKELALACLAKKGRAGMAIVMEVQTGNVLAMANWPSYNLNNFSKYPTHRRRNLCLTDTFEPGSVFKIFLAAATLEEKLLSPGDQLYCENGTFKIGGRRIHDTHKHEELTFTEIIQESSNIGAAKIGLLLGREKLYKYLHGFGFGRKTGIQLPGESKGLLRPGQEWTDLTTANISFGHGVLVTPLQIITAVSCLANQGYWHKPKILKGIVDQRGEQFIIPKSKPLGRIISKSTTQAVTAMLEAAVRSGTGKAAYIPGYRVAGKTGTAQKIDPDTKRYSNKLFYSSFVGFFPANEPQIAILVAMDEPQEGHLAGQVVAPTFQRIAQAIIRYRNMPPVEEEKIDQEKDQDTGLRLASKTGRNGN